jgi:hypothetical protein
MPTLTQSAVSCIKVATLNASSTPWPSRPLQTSVPPASYSTVHPLVVYPSRRPTSTLIATCATLCKHCVSAGPSQSCRLTLFAAAISAPFSSSKATTSKCPYSAARLTEVLPCCSSRQGVRFKPVKQQAARSMRVAQGRFGRGVDARARWLGRAGGRTSLLPKKHDRL